VSTWIDFHILLGRTFVSRKAVAGPSPKGKAVRSGQRQQRRSCETVTANLHESLDLILSLNTTP